MEILIAPERRTKAGLVPSLVNPAWTEGRTADRVGWFARVHVDGLTLDLSRFDDEAGWAIDAAWGGASMPLWANGFGARYLLVKRLKADLGAVLDEMVAAQAVSA